MINQPSISFHIFFDAIAISFHLMLLQSFSVEFILLFKD